MLMYHTATNRRRIEKDSETSGSSTVEKSTEEPSGAVLIYWLFLMCDYFVDLSQDVVVLDEFFALIFAVCVLGKMNICLSTQLDWSC